MHIEVPTLSSDELLSQGPGETSASVRERVVSARRVQLERQGKANADLSGAELDQYGLADAPALETLLQAVERLHLSARSYHRILRVARTIADLKGAERIARKEVLQAVQLRRAGLPNA